MNQILKYWIYVLSTFFVVGITFSSVSSVYANSGHHKFHEEYEQLDAKTKEKVDSILSSLKTDLKELGLKVPDHPKKHESSQKLDDKTKTKVKEIFKQLKSGKITKKEADEKFAALGISPPKKDQHCQAFENLDEKTKTKVKEIFKQKREGTMTKEEAEIQLAELGVQMPKHPMHESYEKLDEETKKKVKIRIEEAKAEFKKLNVTFPKKFDSLTK
ncbi:hypothetical protein H9636_18580 [Ureibacillus sp. Re31]|uniref:Uncharacterized protein n=1 Tax=Ureibacillus galli TaxID=2762222 RepID=A0ABR8XHD2_9BACL|nr:hypothetical protein [Ureibacillus galli]MBD8028642.1 hypothetical protein [Ureibacillus galli]